MHLNKNCFIIGWLNLLILLLPISGYTQQSENPLKRQDMQQVLELMRGGDIEAAKEKLNALPVAGSPCLNSTALVMHSHLAMLEHNLAKADSLLQESGGPRLDDCHAAVEGLYWKQLARIRLAEGDWNGAAGASYMGLEHARKHNDTMLIVTHANILGLVLGELSMYERSLEYYKTAYREYKKTGNKSQLPTLLSNIAVGYGRISEEQKDNSLLDSLAFYSRLTLNAARETGNIKFEQQAFSNLSGAAYLLGEHRTSLLLADSALALPRFPGDERTRSSSFRKRSMALRATGNGVDAIVAADSALALAANGLNPGQISSSLEEKFECLKMLRREGEALQVLEELTALDDSLYRNEMNQTVVELEEKYQSAENRATIERLNYQGEADSLRIRILLLGLALLALLLLIIFLVYRRRVQRERQALIEAELRLNRARINPHFFFNVLATLQSHLLQKPADAGEGQEVRYLGKVAKLMRRSLESTFEDLVTLEEELDFIRDYLEVNLLVRPDAYRFDIEVVGDLEPDACLVPALITQPFVENAIQHGLPDGQTDGHILIRAEAEGSGLRLTITDNGVGLRNGRTQNGTHKSRATEITQDRLFLLEKRQGQRARFVVDEWKTDSTESSGTRVILYLPVIES